MKYLLCLLPIATCCFAEQSPKIDSSADRFETDLQVSYKRIGTLTPKNSSEVKTPVTLGCECIDRDYADYHKYKEYITPLGVKKIRVQGGWAKTEKQKGIYDFSWLDSIIEDANARGIVVYLQTSYGNPLYEGGGTPFLAGGLPRTPEAKAAWDKWVETLAERYKGKNIEWEMWNEPDISKNFSVADTVDINARTAKTIKSVIADAKIAALSLASTQKTKNVENLIDGLAKADALKYFTWISHHGYRYRPEELDKELDFMESVLRKYSKTLILRQGELGAPSKGGLGGALDKHGWTELTQAKWDVRRMLQDHGRGSETSVFTVADLHYAPNDLIKGLNAKGLLQTDSEHNVVKIKKAYYAVQNMTAIIDILSGIDISADVKMSSPLSRSLFAYKDPKSGLASLVVWFNEVTPTNFNATTPVDIEILNVKFKNPVWIDVISGRVYEIPASSISFNGQKTTIKGLPVYDSPALATDASLVDFK